LVKTGNVRKAEKEAARKKQVLKPVEKNKEVKPVLSKREILEREVIKLLLLYGNREITVEDWELKEIPEGNSDPIIEKTERQSTVAEEIYKHLQEDELEFSNPVFTEIYNKIIPVSLNGIEIDIAQLMTELPENAARLISDILMEEEKYSLAKWEERQIEVKPKDANLGWHVIDVLLNLRRLLIQGLINKQKEALKDTDEAKRVKIFDEIKDYLLLFRLISTKLYRFA